MCQTERSLNQKDKLASETGPQAKVYNGANYQPCGRTASCAARGALSFSPICGPGNGTGCRKQSSPFFLSESPQ